VYKVFCDFDETVTMRDVGTEILTRFGTPVAFDIWKEFDAGRKSPAECLRIACETVTNTSAEDMRALIEGQAIRSGFVEFTRFCNEGSIELRIVSDGFSIYIAQILEKYSLGHIPVWTNTIELNSQGRFDVSFDHEREGCSHCASCKCAGVINSSDDTDTIVYVGDGYSDWCPSMMADVVFARRDLKRHCGELGIPHHPFEDFHEVQAILQNYLAERPKYRREQAHRRRKELITIE